MKISGTLLAVALGMSIAAPAVADPTIGLGLSYSFGGGKSETGIGLRLFSDNTRDSVVGSLGVDYQFSSKSWRGTLGAAYLGKNTYIGLDMGLGGGGVDYGVSLGAVGSKAKSSAPIVTPPPDDCTGSGAGAAVPCPV